MNGTVTISLEYYENLKQAKKDLLKILDSKNEDFSAFHIISTGNSLIINKKNESEFLDIIHKDVIALKNRINILEKENSKLNIELHEKKVSK